MSDNMISKSIDSADIIEHEEEKVRALLKLEDITKDYVVDKNVTHALKGVNVEFRPGEFVAILGPSGCGKTTLLNIIGGLDRYTDGNLYINGRSTKEYEDYDWDRYRNKTIGFIFQNYNLIMHQTILSNVELALTLIGVGRAERKKRAMAALESVGLAEHYYKKPNQLSGGQMQRVAIARAIVNDPKILLADEPTGALDSESSKQVMDILKDLSKDRLVIMVTHNDDLAVEYADRIVRIKDGVIVSDTDPFECGIAPEPVKPREKNLIKRIKNFFKHDKAEKHTSMSYESAIRLSANNLSTKKMRTALTSFAGSIGIIGIAIVLSLSSGFSGYIAAMEEDSLSSYPIIVGSSSGISLDQAISMLNTTSGRKEYPDADEMFTNKVLVQAMLSQFADKNQVGENMDLSHFTSEFLEKRWNSEWGYYKYNYNFDMMLWSNNATPDDGTYTRIYPFTDLIPDAFDAYKDMVADMKVMDELPDDDTLNSQYELIYGKQATAADEAVLIVDSKNEVTDFMIFALGLIEVSGGGMFDYMAALNQIKDSYSFADLCYTSEDDAAGLSYNITVNSDQYRDNGDGTFSKVELNGRSSAVTESTNTIKIVGVIRAREGVQNPCMTGAIGYTQALTDQILEYIAQSDVVTAQMANPSTDVLTGEPFAAATEDSDPYADALADLGYSQPGKPNTISIYASSMDAKEIILQMLDEYNEGAAEGGYQAVPKSDVLSQMMGFINSLSDTVTYVMVGFSGISLIVSCIMIGIITYISVMERTKEIGILRSIGARKRDIARVFNAETFMIGLLSGIIGVVFTCIVYFPANAILNAVLGIANLFQLVWWQLVGLVIISVVLTLISGFIPAHMAAKKDPVIALRSE